MTRFEDTEKRTKYRNRRQAADAPPVLWLCPNCHRRCHYADDWEAFNDSLYEKVDAVRRPA